MIFRTAGSMSMTHDPSLGLRGRHLPMLRMRRKDYLGSAGLAPSLNSL